MKINMAAILIRCITIMEKTESLGEAITSKAGKCVLPGHRKKWRSGIIKLPGAKTEERQCD